MTLALIGSATPAHAAVFTVTNVSDAGAGSLRDAILAANGNGAPDAINFIPGLSGTITLTSGQLEIASPLAIQGPGAPALTVSGNHASRVFKVDAGVTATISGLTIADGLVSGGGSGRDATTNGGSGGDGGAGSGGGTGGTGGSGGDGVAQGAAGVSRQGGGIQNGGALTLKAVAVTGDAVAAGSGGNASAIGGAGGGGGTGQAGAGGAGGLGGAGGSATTTGGAGGDAQGGGIYNDGTLAIQNSTVSGNSAVGGNGGNAIATGGGGGAGGAGGAGAGSGAGGSGGNGGAATATGGAGGDARGGGVYNGGTLTVQNSTVSGNSATRGTSPGTISATPGAPGTAGATGATGGGAGGPGGLGSVAMATPGPRGDAEGGGILAAAGTPAVTLTSVTIATDSAPTAANLDNRSVVRLENTIVSDPEGGGANCRGAAASGGSNIDSGASCALGQLTDRPGTDPQIGPLQDNGGPTKTRALAATSPAIDQGVSAGLSSDQRGVPRPSDQPQIANAPGGDGSDIGSFEIPGPQNRDTTLPVIARVSMSPRTWAVDPKARPETAVLARPARKGTTFTYSLSEPARVVFTIERTLPGRQVRGKCTRPAHSNRTKRKCTRYGRFGRFGQQGTAGRNTKKFSGKIGKKRLKPGKYRATLIATDPAGNVSAAKRLSFRVVRR